MIAMPGPCSNYRKSPTRANYCAFCQALLGLDDARLVDAEFDKADRIAQHHRAYRRRHHRRW